MTRQPYGIAVREGDRTKWLYLAQDRQRFLHESTRGNILYGGAAGGGKSHALRWHLITACLKHANFTALLLRRTFPELDKTHILKLRTEVPELIAKWNGTQRRLEFPNGSILQFGHCEREPDVKQYLSTEWGAIGIDEASQWTPWQLRMLASRLRSIDSEVHPQIIYATNPGGPSHLFLKARFLTKQVDLTDDPAYDPNDHEFIPAFVADNAYLGEAYTLRLLSLPAAEREAYLYGNWDSFAGQYFDEWSTNLHTLPAFEIPEWWERVGGLDWGFSPSPAYFGVGAIDPHERIWAYKEIVLGKTSPKEWGRLIHEKCPLESEQRMCVWGDTQMWTQQPDRGVSIADDINEALANVGSGIYLMPANKDRINGWARMHQYLDTRRPQPGGGVGPWLRYFKHNPISGMGCPYAIETIPSQIHKDDNSGDLKKGPTDHGCDGWRYLLMARPALSVLPDQLKAVPQHHRLIHLANQRVLNAMRDRGKHLLSPEADETEPGINVLYDDEAVESPYQIFT